jgi:hypothetical protein
MLEDLNTHRRENIMSQNKILFVQETSQLLAAECLQLTSHWCTRVAVRIFQTAMCSVNVAQSSMGWLLSLNERDGDYRESLMTRKGQIAVLISVHPASIVHCQPYLHIW